jgi:hypothetical protein
VVNSAGQTLRVWSIGVSLVVVAQAVVVSRTSTVAVGGR